MSPEQTTMLINAGIQLIFMIWQGASQASNPGSIPSWEALTDKNMLLQAKIDLEKTQAPKTS